MNTKIITILETPILEAKISARLINNSLIAGAQTLFELLRLYYYREHILMSVIGGKSVNEIEDIFLQLSIDHNSFTEIENYFIDKIDISDLTQNINLN